MSDRGSMTDRFSVLQIKCDDWELARELNKQVPTTSRIIAITKEGMSPRLGLTHPYIVILENNHERPATT